VLFTMLAGRLPFEGTSASHALELITTSEAQLPAHFSPEAADLIQRMLTKDASTRIALDAVARHPWVTGSKLALIPLIDLTISLPAAVEYRLVSPSKAAHVIAPSPVLSDTSTDCSSTVCASPLSSSGGYSPYWSAKALSPRAAAAASAQRLQCFEQQQQCTAAIVAAAVAAGATVISDNSE
jgi:serine/threonine protein kinase